MDIKEGDIVKVEDGSYSITIKDDGDMCYIGGTYLTKENHKVVAFVNRLPTDAPSFNSQNDTIIFGLDTHRTTFIQQRFLIPVNTCPNCGCVLEEKC